MHPSLCADALLPRSDVPPATAPAPVIEIAGRRIVPSRVFDTYWYFASERHRIYEARQRGVPGPWTADAVLAGHRFTNCFRAADRVSQYLIGRVIYTGDQSPAEITFRTLLFKLFNRISTWELLEEQLGPLTWEHFDVQVYDSVLSTAMARGVRLYSAAYVMPTPALGAPRKHTNHLRLLARMMLEGFPERLVEARTMSSVFALLAAYPSLGPFLAYQYTIDLNYSTAMSFDERDYVVAGPGARDGLRKCFGDACLGIEADLIRYVSDQQEEHFARLGLSFGGLRGRQLQLVDCQNLFCEVDKYARVVHPAVAGYSGRTRIKQVFAPSAHPTSAWFPPKWAINLPSDVDAAPGIAPPNQEHVGARVYPSVSDDRDGAKDIGSRLVSRAKGLITLSANEASGRRPVDVGAR